VTEASQPIQVLLVEDNPGDADLTREVLDQIRMRLDLTVVEDGVTALERMRAGPRPDLVLLDLNLPKKGGKEVLAEIRADEALSSIPVVIVTSSEAERDIVMSYQLGANCYVVKPLDLSDFQRIVSQTANFWLSIVKLPPHVD